MQQKRTLNDVFTLGLLAVYMYALLKIILFKFRAIDMTFLWQQLKMSLKNPDLISRRLHEGNLIPFNEISRTIYVLSDHDLINLVGNIVIFMPFGVFLGILSNKKLSLTGAFLLALGLSLCLESAQVLFAIGSFDVDDLILNSSGGLLGCMAFKLCAKLVTAASSVIRPGDRPI